MEKLAQAAGSAVRPAVAQRRALAWITAALAAAALGACERQQKTETPVIPPRAEAAIVPGSAATTVPARTGSESSGTLGSSTVVGAPPPNQAGTALAH
jgi:hypothetical protein